MSRKVLFSAVIASVVSVPFIYLLITQSAPLGVSGRIIATLMLVFAAAAGSAWLSTRVPQSAHNNRRAPRSADKNRASASRKTEAPVATGSPREAGQVKWFNASKGFGFITRDSGEDIFVHFRSIRGDGHRVLKDGQRVEFSVSMGDKGLQADDVAAMPR